MDKEEQLDLNENGLDDLWKPICKTENKELGDCMSRSEAIRIIREHERENPTHVVDIEKC